MQALPTLATAALETAINQLLALDPETRTRLHALGGKVIAVELRGLDTALYLIPTAGKLNVFAHFEGAPDTTLRGTPLAMARMGLADQASDSFFGGEVEIDGDVELGTQFREILDDLDIDWEEHLSHLTGDVLAHQAGKLVREVWQWGGRALDTLARDVTEYLQEERRDLPSRCEVDDFLSAVDTLRSDVDRLHARIRRLEARSGNKRP